MENKIILAYYIGIGNIEYSDIGKYIQSVQEKISSPDDKNMIQYFIPVRDESNVRIECVYPKYVLGEDVDKEFKSTIKRLDKHIKNITNEQ